MAEKLLLLDDDALWFYNLVKDDSSLAEFQNSIHCAISAGSISNERWLALAAHCLVRCVQANFVGPPISKFPPWFPDVLRNVPDSLVLQFLTVDLDQPNPCMSYPQYLFAAKLILLDNCSHWLSVSPLAAFWVMRCAIVLQNVLNEIHSQLKDTALASARSLAASSCSESHPFLEEFLGVAEIAGVFLTYGAYMEAKECLDRALSLSGLSVELTGMLGTRTRFQVRPTAQLVVDVKVENRTNRAGQAHILPKDCALNDDTLLDDTQFIKSHLDSDERHSLSADRQCVLFALLTYCRKTAPAGDPLTAEEVSAHLRFILTDPQNWSVQSAALYMRSCMESDHRRRVERSLSQLEELFTQFSRSDPPTPARLQLIFPLLSFGVLPSRWLVRKSQAQLLQSIGCVREASDIFYELELWEEVISCYRQLNKLTQAEHLIRERLAIGETPSLLCLLGEVTEDPQQFEKAFELSGSRSATAMRLLGMALFRLQDFEGAITALQKSLSLQPLQVAPWFTLGYCAMKLEKFELSAQAYHKCVSLEPDNFEAWNNLSAACVQMKRNEKAFWLLQEALKYNFEHVKVWENFLLVCVDSEHFEDAIRAVNRLMDLTKGKWANVEVLERLVAAQRNDSNLRAQLLTLFGRITANFSAEIEVWDKCARLFAKSLQLSLMQKDWEKDVEKCRKILLLVMELLEYCAKLFGKFGREAGKNQWSSLRFPMKSSLAKFRSYYGDDENLSSELKCLFSESARKFAELDS